jgi:beta-glucosidase/6-phospho-beta-glucosidase/beta-galactosidase
MLEYVQWCKEMKKEYNATEFYNWLGVNYYVGDFIRDEEEEVELTTSYLIDEINQTIEDNK